MIKWTTKTEPDGSVIMTMEYVPSAPQAVKVDLLHPPEAYDQPDDSEGPPEALQQIYAVDDYWKEHYMKYGMCSLCGQTGRVDTRGLRTPAGVEVGRMNWCLCANGRAMRQAFMAGIAERPLCLEPGCTATLTVEDVSGLCVEHKYGERQGKL